MTLVVVTTHRPTVLFMNSLHQYVHDNFEFYVFEYDFINTFDVENLHACFIQPGVAIVLGHGGPPDD